jgi:hypothetical protein
MFGRKCRANALGVLGCSHFPYWKFVSKVGNILSHVRGKEIRPRHPKVRMHSAELQGAELSLWLYDLRPEMG